mmetsp:Transcript_14119/g.12466  ORF Transcript_14119/g.12466 Transcript_14119/m.12466 type:complete len:106 (-) Transcript_14119:397-714(-)
MIWLKNLLNKIKEPKEETKDFNHYDNLPPINQNNKYVTFSVSASKDFKMSLIKKSVNREAEFTVDTERIRELLNLHLANSAPIDLYTSLIECTPEPWKIYTNFRK